jgi:hypothetical protein
MTALMQIATSNYHEDRIRALALLLPIEAIEERGRKPCIPLVQSRPASKQTQFKPNSVLLQMPMNYFVPRVTAICGALSGSDAM